MVKFPSAVQLTGPRTVCELLLLKRKITVAAVAELETRLGPDGRRDVPTVNHFMNRSESSQANCLAIDCFLGLCHYTSRHGFTEISENESGVAPGIFRWGADSSDEGAKILFLGYFHCPKSPKNSLPPSDSGANMFRRGLVSGEAPGPGASPETNYYFLPIK